MATQTVDYLACSKICCGSTPAAVIICLPAALVAEPVCSDNEEANETYPRAYVHAELSNERCFSTGCRISYVYSITVDESALAEDVTLSGSEITGVFCETCTTDWVADAIGEEPYILTDEGGSQSFVSPHGCVYPLSVGISPTFQHWDPVYSASGAMTFTSVTTDLAEYIQIGDMVTVMIRANGTTGGVASSVIRFSLPITAGAWTGSGTFFTPCGITDGAGVFVSGLVGFAPGATEASVSYGDGVDFGLGVGRQFYVSFSYKGVV